MKRLPAVVALLFLFIRSFSQTTDTSFAAYAGKYLFPVGYATESVNVCTKDKQLILSSKLGTITLVRTHKDTFMMPDYEGSISFMRDSTSGKVTKIHCRINSIAIDEEGDVQDFDAVGEK